MTVVEWNNAAEWNKGWSLAVVSMLIGLATDELSSAAA